MPFNGSGSFVSLPAPDFPAVAGQPIYASQFNVNLNDIFSGLSDCVTRDGQSPATANLPMGGFKHTGVGAGTATGQYLAFGTAAQVTTLLATGTVTIQPTTLPRIALISLDASAGTIAFQKSATWNYAIAADATSMRLGVVGVVDDAIEILPAGYVQVGSRFAFNGKTPIANVAAPAVAVDLATALTLINDMRTRLVNVGIYT